MGSTVTGALATAAVVLILLAGHLDRGSCRRRRPSRGVLPAFDGMSAVGGLPNGPAPHHHGPSDGGSSWSGSDGVPGSSC
jgi:hypothetical protein